MRRIIAALIIFGVLAVLGSFLPERVSANSSPGSVTSVAVTQMADMTAEQCKGGHIFFIFPTWYKYLNFNDDCTIKAQIVTNAGSSYDAQVVWLVGFAVIEILLTLAGVVAFVFVMIGGFKFVTAQGSPEAIVSARKTLANAIVGAIIAVIASRTVSFIAGKLSNKATASEWGLVPADTSNALATISNYALTILGALSVITIIIAGIQFMVSSANPDKVKKARSAIYFALAGLAIAILASTIINFVIGKTT